MARRNQDFQTIRSEGGLLPADLLRRVLERSSNLAGTRPEDYGLPAGERLNEVITQSWNRLRKHWAEFQEAAENLPGNEAGTGLTNDRWNLPLLRELGFGLLPTSAGPEIEGRTYAISRFFGPVPVHLIGCGLSLDRRSAGQRGAAVTNPHGLVQEFLNRSDAHLWALLSNGLRLRVLRDNQALSRQSFLEFDLEAMMGGEVYSDFVLLWLVVHATRFAPREGGPETCWLEQWTQEAEEQGTRALGELRRGVEQALAILGEGFTSHPRNTALRDVLRSGQLSPTELHAQLLRLVYRLIFLFVAEDRTLEGQSLLHPRDDTEAARIARDRYATHYSTARLREMAGKIKGSRHGDLWQQFQILVRALSDDTESETVRQQLALPALGSFLWDPASTPDLNDAELTNFDLLEALRHLAFTRQGKVLRPVDYKNLGAEELGGIYESLLALTPQVSGDGARFSFAEFAGNERKTSGSYYTPDSLVQCLLDSALDPVVEEAIKGKSPAEAEQAIIALKVCDPAVGSGHFLVGAAHRLARHLARVRALAEGESEPSPLLYQHALRDVIGRCLYGVDANPMAAELCRVSLWLEALEPGKPLSFLDHHIRVGNSLLGTTPELIAAGLPDDAFKPIEGDDKQICSQYKKQNKKEREFGDRGLLLQVAEPQAEYDTLASRSQGLDQAPDDSMEAIKRKAEQFRRLVISPEFRHRQLVADAWCAAFVWPKTAGAPDPITTDTIRRLEEDANVLDEEQREALERLANRYQFFHWQLAFPEVFAQGGFDVVLGNPPWETMSPDSKEFFSTYDPSVRAMSPTDQKATFERLLEHPGIAAKWEEYCRDLYAAVHFMKSSSRYRLFAPGNLGKGDFNVYRMFVETALAATRPEGVAAQFVPEGLYNGANATAIRKELFDNFRLTKLGGFENTREIWFKDIDSRTKFCLYAAQKGGRTERFAAAFRINTMERLQDFAAGQSLAIPVRVVAEFSPDAMAVMEFAAQSEIDVCAKMYGLYPKFGVEIEGLPHRYYMREVDMGTDRGLFSEGDEGLPVFEGRMIDAYDYRAKGYVSGRGRSAVWDDLPFGSPTKRIQPQWRILPENIPDKLAGRIDRYRIGFGDVASPTNQRGLIAALLPGSSVSGHKVPTIEFLGGDDQDLLLWLGVANSLVMDYLVRKKVSLTMSYTIMDSLPFPRAFDSTPASHEITRRVCALCAVGPEMAAFRETAVEAGILASVTDIVEAPDRRAVLAAEIDVLVAREVYGLTRDEMLYIVDPANVLGEHCGIETFKALRNREVREFGSYRTQTLILDAWQRLERRGSEAPFTGIPASMARREPLLSTATVPTGAWARPRADHRTETGVQLVAILKAMTGPLPARQVRLAALLALEPRLLLPYLDDEEAASWRRLIGSEADPLPQGASALVARNDQAWGAAVRNLRANGHLIEDIQADTWAPGDSLDRFPTSGWPEGRASIVLNVLQRHSTDTVVTALPDDLKDWVNDVAAA